MSKFKNKSSTEREIKRTAFNNQEMEHRMQTHQQIWDILLSHRIFTRYEQNSDGLSDKPSISSVKVITATQKNSVTSTRPFQL